LTFREEHEEASEVEREERRGRSFGTETVVEVEGEGR